VPVIGGPAPNVWVQTADDLRCWTLPVRLQRGLNGAVMPVHLGLLGLRQQGPFVPLDLEAQEGKPYATRHNPGFGFTALQPSPPQKSCQRGENMLFEHLPRRGDDHESVRVSNATDAFVRSRFPGWTLWIASRIVPVAEAFHAIQGKVRQQGCRYTSYKVANMLVEFSTSIPRTQLRPGYGDGFLGAPLQMRPVLRNPAPREQGGQRGSSTTPSQQNPGGAPHV
jgi:hypothetical protein